MKKIFLLASMLALLSCEQEDLVDNLETSNVTELQQAKSRATIADFDPIAELKGIEVNLLNMGGGSKKYLSCVEKGTTVDLYDKDDGSMRQRWYIGDNSIKLVGGSKTFAGKDAYVTPNNNLITEPYPILSGSGNGMPTLTWCGSFMQINNDLVIGYAPINEFLIDTYLQPESTNSSTLKYKKGNNDMSTHWEILPVGEFDVINIQYVEAAGDYVTLDAPEVFEYVYPNKGNPNPGNAVFKTSTTVKYISSFQKTERVSISQTVSSSLSASIGTPVAIGGSLSTQVTTSYDWSYTVGKTEERTRSIEDSYTYVVPANTNLRMDVYVASYHLNVTYVMTLRRRHDAKTFKVKGKWNGVQGTRVTYQPFDLDTGKELGVPFSRDVEGKKTN